MSKKGYMNLSLSRGESAKYEQVIEVDDFVRLLKEKNEIITSLGEIFPGLRAACVIKTYNHREIPNSEIKFYNRQDQQIKLKTGNILFTVGLLKEGGAGGGAARLAGLVEVNIAGKVDHGKMGDFEKDNYQELNTVLMFSSRNRYSTSRAMSRGMFLHNPSGQSAKKVALKLKLELYHPGSAVSRMVLLPKSLRSENTLSSLNKAIMKDTSTADLTIRADSSNTFRVHKCFICARFVKYISFLSQPGSFSFCSQVSRYSCPG